jgi:methylated-DNA-[protein]-cysteine S-methyltransferase
MDNLFYYDTVIGRIGISEHKGQISHLFFATDQLVSKQYVIQETTGLQEAGKQLREYLTGGRKEFQLRFAPAGTEFMRRVWTALLHIPYGHTQTYKQIAASLGNEKASRAVGLANHKNPLPIFIPCHRVIGTNGKMVGYRGGIAVKEYLLNLENR